MSNGEKVRLQTPTLVLVCGMAGSGKTTLSHVLLQKLQMVYLNKDTLMDAFTTQREGEHYESIRESLYAGMYLLALDNLQIGNSVLVDSPHTKYFPERLFAQFPVKVIWCYASSEIVRERLCQRKLPRDNAKLAAWDSHYRREWMGFVPNSSIIMVVNTSGDYDTGTIMGFIR